MRHIFTILVSAGTVVSFRPSHRTSGVDQLQPTALVQPDVSEHGGIATGTATEAAEVANTITPPPTTRNEDASTTVSPSASSTSGVGLQAPGGAAENHHNVVLEALDNVGNITDRVAGGKKVTDLTGVKMNTGRDLHLILKGVAFSVVGGFFFLTCWLILCRYVPATYRFRVEPDLDGYDDKLAVPEETGLRSLRGWFGILWTLPDEQIYRVAGLDALMLCEFNRVCRNIILQILPVTIFVLAPMHYTIGLPTVLSLDGKTHIDMDFLGRCGIFAMFSAWSDATYLKEKPALSHVMCWVHVLVVYYVVIVTVREIGQAQQRFLSHRFRWLKEMPRKRATTLMVERIPKRYRTDAALGQYFSAIFSDKAVKRSYIVRKTGKLRKFWEAVNEKKQDLAVAEADNSAADQDEDSPATIWMRIFQAMRIAKTTEEDLVLRQRQLEQAQKALEAEQARIAEGARQGDPAVVSSSGFVTFTSRRWCRLASREQLKADAWKMAMSAPPDPQDVRYQDLMRNHSMLLTNETIAMLLTSALFVVWFPVTVVLTSLTSLDSLLHYQAFFWLRPLCEHHVTFKTILESVLATLVLQFFLAYLPSLLLAIIHRFLTLKGGLNATLMMQNRYFFFLLVFVVLVSAINKTLIHSMEELLTHPNHVFIMIAKLPSSSNFYVSYTVLSWFSLIFGLLRLTRGITYAYYTLRHGMSPNEARANTEPEDTDGDGIGARLAVSSIMMTITLMFCGCSPFITIAGLVYFTLSTLVMRWRVTYVETRKPDLGGAFWVLALKHMYVAVGLYILLMSSLMVPAPLVWDLPTWIVACSCLPLLFGYFRFTHLTWEVLPFEVIAQADKAFQRKITKMISDGDADTLDCEGEYYQEECGKDAKLGSIAESDGLSLEAGVATSTDEEDMVVEVDAGTFCEKVSRSSSSARPENTAGSSTDPPPFKDR